MRIASGATTAVIRMIQPIVKGIGWCIGKAAPGASGWSLPQSSRTAWVSDEMGFHSAMKRSTVGIWSVGAKVLARNVIGNMVANMTPLTASTERIAEPTQIPTQIIAKPQPRSSR